jgi:hypothetical protein
MLARQTSKAPGATTIRRSWQHQLRLEEFFKPAFAKEQPRLCSTLKNFRLSTSARRSPTEKSYSSEANTNARSQIADAHESAICHGISAPRHIAPCWLQLHLSYLTGALFELLNGRVRGKIFVRRFPQAQKFCASMPICSDVRGNST